MAVAVATLRESIVTPSGGKEGILMAFVTHCMTSGEMPLPSLPMTMIPWFVKFSL